MTEESSENDRLFNKLGNYPPETVAVEMLIAVLSIGSALLLRPEPESPSDFLQAYASARNLLSVADLIRAVRVPSCPGQASRDLSSRRLGT